MNPSNIERTGDRDLYISTELRKTRGVDGGIRQYDWDFACPQTYCDHCRLIVAFVEYTRGELRDKATTNQVAESKNGMFQRPVYCVKHNGKEGRPATFFTVEQRYCPVNHRALCINVLDLKSEQEHIEWVQNLYNFHLTICPAVRCR